MKSIGVFLIYATEMTPIVMGILVSVTIGILLVMPTSSTAIAIMISLTGVASGASAAGACAICVGFGIASYRENKTKGAIAQIFGSPMIQVGNIMRNPLILVPPALACAVVGPLATTILKISCVESATGTGTWGLVSPIGIYASMTAEGHSVIEILFKIAVLCFIIPAIVSFFSSEFLRKINFIKFGDMQLDL